MIGTAVPLWGCDEGATKPAPTTAEVPSTVGSGACRGAAAQRPEPLEVVVGDFCPGETSGEAPGAVTTNAFAAACVPAFRDTCDELSKLGLSRSWTRRYVHDSGGPASVEANLARFASPDGAFAAFTNRILLTVDPYAPDVRSVPGLEHAVAMGASTYAVVGSDLIELHYSDPWKTPEAERSEGLGVLSQFASALRARLPQDVLWPRTMELLPKEKRLPWGVRVSYRRAFGLEGAGPAALGYYSDGAIRYQLFVASTRDEASAADIFRSIRRTGDGRRLEDFPFDCFELSGSAGFGEPPGLWLVGKNGSRVAAVGSAPPQPPGHHTSAERNWLTRPEKLQLLRRVFNRR